MKIIFIFSVLPLPMKNDDDKTFTRNCVVKLFFASYK